jgi:hypothetical protein
MALSPFMQHLPNPAGLSCEYGKSKVRKDLMVSQIGFMGISSRAWAVIGIVAGVVGILLIGAMVLLAFGWNIGDVISS